MVERFDTGLNGSRRRWTGDRVINKVFEIA